MEPLGKSELSPAVLLGDNSYLQLAYALGCLELCNKNNTNSDNIITELVQELQLSIGLTGRNLFHEGIIETGDWIKDFVHLALPGEIKNHFAFYLGAGYITGEEYRMLEDALKTSQVVYSGTRQRDGRDILEGHVLPGMRFIFDNREELLNGLEYTRDDYLPLFKLALSFLGHHWVREDKGSKSLKFFLSELSERGLLNGIEGKNQDNGVDADWKKVLDTSECINRICNNIGNLSKAPTLEEIKSEKSSHASRYREETTELISELEGNNIPCTGKLKEVLELVEGDAELNIRFLSAIRNISMEYWGAESEKFKRSERLIQFLEDNAEKLGVWNTTGLVGAIYLKSLLDDQSRVQEIIDKYKEDENFSKLLTHSLGLAISYQGVTELSNFNNVDILSIYKKEPGFFNLESLFNESLDQEKKQQLFSDCTVEYCSLRPVEPPVDDILAALELDLEGSLLLALEILESVQESEDQLSVDTWLKLQKGLYFILPVLEAGNIKTLGSHFSDIVRQRLNLYMDRDKFVRIREIYEKSFPRHLGLANTVRDKLQDSIERLWEDANITSGVKRLGSITDKVYLRNKLPTDVVRARVVFSRSMKAGELLEKSVKVIHELIAQILQSMEDGTLSDYIDVQISRPNARPLKISLKDLSKEQINTIMGEESDPFWELVERKTDYEDVKVVLALYDHDENPTYVEVQFVDDGRNWQNTFGSGTRIMRSMRESTKDGENIDTDLMRLEKIGERLIVYQTMPTSRVLSYESLRRLKDRFPNISEPPFQLLSIDKNTALIRSVLSRLLVGVV